MARESCISRSSVNTIWRAFKLLPHLTEIFKFSTDPGFVEKVRDIVGMYMSLPQNAVVFSVDEKSEMQALDRTQPLRPMRSETPSDARMITTARGTSSFLRASWSRPAWSFVWTADASTIFGQVAGNRTTSSESGHQE